MPAGSGATAHLLAHAMPAPSCCLVPRAPWQRTQQQGPLGTGMPSTRLWCPQHWCATHVTPRGSHGWDAAPAPLCTAGDPACASPLAVGKLLCCTGRRSLLVRGAPPHPERVLSCSGSPRTAERCPELSTRTLTKTPPWSRSRLPCGHVPGRSPLQPSCAQPPRFSSLPAPLTLSKMSIPVPGSRPTPGPIATPTPAPSLSPSSSLFPVLSPEGPHPCPHPRPSPSSSSLPTPAGRCD